MKYKSTLLTVGLLCLLGSACIADQRPSKPNILLLLTDDLGWQDVKCYDIDEPSPAETPNLDALAKKGVLFWQAYSPAPTCAPSRCAIMSGNHPARAQKTHVVGGAPPKPHNKNMRLMDPWYSGRMPEDTFTLARAMKQNGYVTGHAGKWHIAINHHSFPQPEDVGFDWTRSERGAHAGMKDRLSGFATTSPNDPYRLDKNGFPFHQNNEDALTFIRENQDKPFFLYYATWLVHSPIMTRNEALLNKYVKKLGVDPKHINKKDVPGQLNPYYFAMVESLDYYVGQVFHYLETTEDPRWPGHMLSENTYIIFTSDNGGMEGSPKERYTDNAPLSRGKISAMEGGTRVPLIITGPGIRKGVQSDVMVNGLDFYPTILGLIGSENPTDKHLDGLDVSTLLLNDPTNPALVKEEDGSVRDTMMWHFPHGVALESTIRIGDYKLVRNYDHANSGTPELELFQLYKTKGRKQERGDIEEVKNLADNMPEKAMQLNRKLTEILTEMKASYPFYNPNCNGDLPGKESAPTVLSHRQKGNVVEFSCQENGAKVVRADLIYTLNGGERDEEWFRTPAIVLSGAAVSADLPAGTTHYYINVIDENNFMRSYPEVGNKPFSKTAIQLGGSKPSAQKLKKSQKPAAGKSFAALLEKDANQDGQVTKAEYIEFHTAGFERKDKNKDGLLTPDEHAHASFKGADGDKDGQLTREEYATIFERQFDNGFDKNGDGVATADEM